MNQVVSALRRLPDLIPDMIHAYSFAISLRKTHACRASGNTAWAEQDLAGESPWSNLKKAGRDSHWPMRWTKP
jgi:hypothetical protein